MHGQNWNLSPPRNIAKEEPIRFTVVCGYGCYCTPLIKSSSATNNCVMSFYTLKGEIVGECLVLEYTHTHTHT